MQSLIHMVEWKATTLPDHLAVSDDRGHRLTYSELLKRIEGVAGSWAAGGVNVGDVVVVAARNSTETLVQIIALMRAGAIPALLNWRLSAPELRNLIEILDPVAVAADSEFCELVTLSTDRDWRQQVVLHGEAPNGWEQTVLAPTPPRPVEALLSNSVCALLHTSGTTGLPKAIPLTHRSQLQSPTAMAMVTNEMGVGSPHLRTAPMFHLAGLGGALVSLVSGGSLYLHDAFDAARILDTIVEHKIEFTNAGPTPMRMLLDEYHRRSEPPDVSSLKEIWYGTAPMPPALLREAMTTFGCRFRQNYGMTEAQCPVSQLGPEDHHPDSPHLASAGRVAFGWELKLVSPEGVEQPTGEPGEILIRGDNLFPGYWKNPEATAAAFVDGPAVPRGLAWYRTGDIGRLDDEGYLTILDRAKDMIISGGENIFPAEVEAVLDSHPDVSYAAVIGVPSDKWGESVMGLIILKEVGIGEADLIEFCRERLAHFKCPRSIEFVEKFPRNATGKVLKRELRERYSKTAERTVQ